MLSPLEHAQQYYRTATPMVLAVVSHSYSSAPCPVGSLMVIINQQLFYGSVSGGCVEGAVIEEAMALLGQNNLTKQLHYGISNARAWEYGLACGGEIDIILIKCQKSPLFDAFFAQLHQPPALLVSDNNIKLIGELLGPNQAVPQNIFVWRAQAPVILYLVGAVHMAQILLPLIAQNHWQARVIDPRAAFNNDGRFPASQIILEYPGDYFAQNPLKPSHALVCLSHDSKIDDEALFHGLQGTPFYIGALGGKKTHLARMERLSKMGVSAQLLQKIHAPIGLDIHSQGPLEIAISIMAQLIKIYHEI